MNEKSVEFVDISRFEIGELFYDFLETENTLSTKIHYLKYLISKDKFFFDPYVILSDLYLLGRDEMLYSHRILEIGFKRLFKKVFKNKFPKQVDYYNFSNRHIYRLLFHYALSMWSINKKSISSDILIKLIEYSPNDPLGARYMFVALLEGYSSYFEFLDKVENNKINKWFLVSSKKYLSRYEFLKFYHNE